MRPWRVGAATIAGLALLAALDVRTGAPVAIRAPAGALLVLVLPGSAWLLLDRRERRPVETAALVVAASMGITMVTGLVLDALPGGLTAHSWSIGLLLVTLAGTSVPWLRTFRRFRPLLGSPAAARPVGRAVVAGWSARRLVLFAVGSSAVILLIALLAWVSVASNAGSYRREHFTVLSLDSASSDVLVVGVEDHEEATVGYRLVAVSQGETVFAHRFALDSGAATSVPVRLPSDTVLLDSRLEIDLYRVGHAGVYRSLALTPHEGRWL